MWIINNRCSDATNTKTALSISVQKTQNYLDSTWEVEFSYSIVIDGIVFSSYSTCDKAKEVFDEIMSGIKNDLKVVTI